MKKALALLLALALIGGAVFAQEAAYTVSGNAKLIWGYNLDTQDHGFNNTYEFDLTFPLIKDATAGASGEGIYGEISISGFDLGITMDEKTDVPAFDATDYDITAKLNINDLYITVYDKPSFAFNQAAFIKPYSIDDYDDNDSGDFPAADKSLVRPSIDIKGGTAIGYNLADLGKFELRVASVGDWGATTAKAATYTPTVATAAITEAAAIAAKYYNYATSALWATGNGAIAIGGVYGVELTKAVVASGNDKYVFGFNTTLTPIDMLTLNFGAMYNADTKVLGLTAKATLLPMDGLTVVAAMDAGKTDEDDMVMDIFGSVGYAFNDAKDTISLETYFANNAAQVAKIPTSDWSRLDVAAKFSDKEGFVPGLTVDLAVIAMDLLADPAHDPMRLAFAEKLAYKVMLEGANYIRPYQEFATDLQSEALYLKVGMDVSVVTNTLFTLEYKAGAIADDALFNSFVTDAVDNNLGKGIFKFTTKISF